MSIVPAIDAATLPPFSLTTRAIMRGPPCQDHPLNFRRAAHALLARTTIDAKFVLELPFESGAADVVANAGPALLDGARQNGNDGMAQGVTLLARQFRPRQGGVQARFIERFVRIDIADASDDRLIEQDRLEISPRA